MAYYPASIDVFKRELSRPWKMATFAIAMAILIYGSYYYSQLDWDVPISIIMGVLAYVWAPWCVGALIFAFKQRPRNWYMPVVKSLAVAYFCASGTWALYNILRLGWETTRYIYIGNQNASLLLFVMAGIFWQYEGSLKDMFRDVAKGKTT
jgi:hypothetical protein